MNTTIKKTFGIGDAGLPFTVSIDVEYEQQGNKVFVTDWTEDRSPYDNPPELWYEQMKEIIDEHFINDIVVFGAPPKPFCPCGVPEDLHSTTMCGWGAALMPSDDKGFINDSRHPGYGKPFMSWKQQGNATIKTSDL
jgi:hypothetical protein